VLFIVWLLGGYDVGNKKIKEWAKLSYPTIANSCETLKIEGLITHTKRTDGWQLTSLGAGMFWGEADPSEKVFDSAVNSSSNLNLIDVNIKELNTTTIKEPSEKVFDSPEYIRDFLKETGVWEKEWDILAELVDNDLLLLKNHFYKTDIPLAIWKIKNLLPPAHDHFKPCRECEKYPCECICEDCEKEPCECIRCDVCGWFSCKCESEDPHETS
jgi:hypothetical protein